jgi:hypothetical protein
MSIALVPLGVIRSLAEDHTPIVRMRYVSVLNAL